MFFMIGCFPSKTLLRSCMLMNPATGRIESAEIWQTGQKLVLFFLPVWTFSRQFLVLFKDSQDVGELLGLDPSRIMDAGREELQQHLQMIQTHPQTVTCSHCGSILENHFSYCPHCGHPVE